jgi:ferredoxin/flavodoxin
MNEHEFSRIKRNNFLNRRDFLINGSRIIILTGLLNLYFKNLHAGLISNKRYTQSPEQRSDTNCISKKDNKFNINIYYFTGTGNSLAVARGLASSLGASIMPVAALIKQESIPIDADGAGIVFPVYHSGLPLIIKRFVEKLVSIDDKYLFAVCTYGGSVGLAIKDIRELVKERGGILQTGFGIHMPYNYLTPTFTFRDFYGSFTIREVSIKKQKSLIKKSAGKINNIAGYIQNRQTGKYEVTYEPLTRLADALNLEESMGKSSWLKIAGVKEDTGLSFIESRQLMDKAFRADDNCNSCGACVQICPVDNIALSNNKPEWLNRCEQCFACLHWCPEQAIQFGDNTAGRKRYNHPDIKLADMIKQAS